MVFLNYIIVDTYKELSKKAANIIVSQVTLKPNCVLGLATGSTPLGTYSNMVEKYNAGDVDFSKVTSFNLDEYVGLDSLHNQSYRYFMNENLFSKINIKKEKTFVPNGMAENLIEEGKEYDRLIESFGGIDLQLLGIGIDGHIGFNEPDKVFTAETHIAELDDSTIKANSRFFNSEKDGYEVNYESKENTSCCKRKRKERYFRKGYLWPNRSYDSRFNIATSP